MNQTTIETPLTNTLSTYCLLCGSEMRRVGALLACPECSPDKCVTATPLEREVAALRAALQRIERLERSDEDDSDNNRWHMAKNIARAALKDQP